MAAMSRENDKVSIKFVTFPDRANSIFQQFCKFLKDKRASMRLMACTCIANLYRCKAIDGKELDISIHLIPPLIKLFSESGGIKARAPLILAYLVSDSEDLQKAACESDAIAKLAPNITSSDIHPQFKEVR